MAERGSRSATYSKRPFPASRSNAPCQNIRDGIMANTKKLSVEKALNKLREADARQSKSTRHDEEIDALAEEIKRMRAQRLRLERPQRKKP
jgi:hypothetical protein